MSEEESMLRSVVRRPSPATIIALLVLVIVAAPLADAAQKAVSSPKAQSAAEKKKKSTSKTVEKAKYADNAGKIRGYSVGFAALPNRVVLTDGKGKLPAAVIPAGTQVGPQGPQGIPGVQGPKGAGFGQVRLVPTPPVSSTTGDVATAEADCDASEKVVGGGYDVVYPVRATATDRSGPVEIRINKPVVPDPSNGISGWEVQAVRLPPEVAFVSDGAGGVKAQPPTSPDKLVVIKAWAVCAK
jgi:hypothetical protein